MQILLLWCMCDNFCILFLSCSCKAIWSSFCHCWRHTCWRKGWLPVAFVEFAKWWVSPIHADLCFSTLFDTFVSFFVEFASPPHSFLSSFLCRFRFAGEWGQWCTCRYVLPSCLFSQAILRFVLMPFPSKSISKEPQCSVFAGISVKALHKRQRDAPVNPRASCSSPPGMSCALSIFPKSAAGGEVLWLGSVVRLSVRLMVICSLMMIMISYPKPTCFAFFDWNIEKCPCRCCRKLANERCVLHRLCMDTAPGFSLTISCPILFFFVHRSASMPSGARCCFAPRCYVV